MGMASGLLASLFIYDWSRLQLVYTIYRGCSALTEQAKMEGTQDFIYVRALSQVA